MVRRLLALALALMLATSAPASAEEDRSGRPQALVLTTGFGLYQGIALSILLDEHGLMPSNSDDAVVAGSALTLATTGLGFGLGWWVTEKYGVTEAQSGLFTSTTLWVALNGVSGGLGVGLDDYDELMWNTLISGWTGQALGILLAANVDRTAGQISLMNTVATWTGAEAALMQAVFGVELGASYITWPTLLADIGLLVGVYLARDVDISRGRARLLDLGAFAGALAGPAALFMVWGPEDDLREWYLSAMAIGIPVGIGVAWYLTRDLDRGDEARGEAPAESSGAIMIPLAGGFF